MKHPTTRVGNVTLKTKVRRLEKDVQAHEKVSGIRVFANCVTFNYRGSGIDTKLMRIAVNHDAKMNVSEYNMFDGRTITLLPYHSP